jgi:hypothetical protein
MKPLNRPMFRMGGPIKEGIMDGIKEPRQGYNKGKIVSKILNKIPGGQKIISGTKDIIPRTIDRIKNFYKTPPSTSKDLVIYNAKEAAKRNPAFLTNRYLFEKGIKPVAGGIFKTGKAVLPYTGVGTLAAGGGLGIYNMLKDPKIDDDGISEINKVKAAIGMPENLTIRKDMSTAENIADKLNEDAVKTAEELRKEKIQRYRDIVDIKGMNKDAAYNSLIAASKAISESGDFKGDLKSGRLINQIIQGASKAFDKPQATKDAIDTLILKGEIDKDIAAGKPSTLEAQINTISKNLKVSKETATKMALKQPTDLRSQITEDAALMKSIPTHDIIANAAKKQIPGAIVLYSDLEVREKFGDKISAEEIVKTEDAFKTAADPSGVYIIGKEIVVVDKQGEPTTIYP